MPDPWPWKRLLHDLRWDRDTSSARLPDAIGKYRILDEIGRTQSSTVYLGHDPALDRRVAIKVLRPDRSLPDFISRFQREGQIAASLRHPNVIAIHEVGTWEMPGGGPVPYIVMDFVEGGTLAGKTFSVRQVAEIGASIAEAIDHSHREGIVHRDLKPDNVLLEPGGRPVVTDFGLAKSVDLRNAATQEGMILGTPQYMAPEQIRADGRSIDSRTDVYALGAILYELLTHTPPHADTNAATLFRRILEEEPLPPRKRVSGIPADLETVVLKALEKDPGRRYPSAGRLALDLRRYLSGQPIEARAPSPGARLWRKALRHRAVLLPFALSLLGGLIWLTGTLFERAKARRQAMEIVAEARRQEREGDLLKARDGYRKALDRDPAQSEAKEAFRRVDEELRRHVLPPEIPSSDGVSWIELGGSASGGGISNNPGASFGPVMVIDEAGHPVVAWHDYTGGTDDVYLRRWDGASWIELDGSGTGGGVSQTPGRSRDPCLALDSSGNPSVAWDDDTSGKWEIYFRRWANGGWRELNGSATGRGLSQLDRESINASMALDSMGYPVIAWQCGVEDRFLICLRRWDGHQWTELDGSGSGLSAVPGGVYACLPALALDRQDRPALAWLEVRDGLAELLFRKWDGTRWTEPESLLQGRRIHVHRPIGWVHDRPSLALDGTGTPTIAWRFADETASAIHLLTRRESHWVELGGSGSGAGVSGLHGECEYPQVVLDPAGHPVVAWADDRLGRGNFNVYLRKWSGSNWIDLGGSSRGRGISEGVTGSSSAPSLALDRAGRPFVAWTQNPGSPEEIYLRGYKDTPESKR